MRVVSDWGETIVWGVLRAIILFVFILVLVVVLLLFAMFIIDSKDRCFNCLTDAEEINLQCQEQMKAREWTEDWKYCMDSKGVLKFEGRYTSSDCRAGCQMENRNYWVVSDYGSYTYQEYQNRHIKQNTDNDGGYPYIYTDQGR